MANKFKTSYLLSAVCILLAQSCFAIIGIDIDQISLKRKGSEKTVIRVMHFDTSEQKFDRIDYFASEVAPSRSFKDLFSHPDIPHLKIDLSGKVKVEPALDLGKFMLRVKGELKAPDGVHTWCDAYGHTILQRQNVQSLSVGAVKKKLGSYTAQKKKGDDFSLDFWRVNSAGKIKHDNDKVTFKKIYSESNNNKERGRIGETATLLTMINFGYKPLISKYGVDHGIDGVFESKGSEILFLTESKCRGESRCATKYLEQDLAEKKILKKLQKMSKKSKGVKETAKVIRSFIQDNPNSIWKFAHRIKPDGTCQWAFEQFSINEDKQRPPQEPVVKEDDRVRLMRETCDKMGELSLKDKVEIFMKANGCSAQAIQAILIPISEEEEKNQEDN